MQIYYRYRKRKLNLRYIKIRITPPFFTFGERLFLILGREPHPNLPVKYAHLKKSVWFTILSLSVWVCIILHLL